MNVLKSHLRITIETLLTSGTSQHEIARRTGVDRKTIRRYAALANSSGVATGSASAESPPRSAATSACAPHQAWIETQVGLGRNAVSIYQDLVDQHGFTHRYNSVKRFVAGLKARAPERFDVLEFLPGEEAQVDYGQGARTRTPTGTYKRPYLFVMTLKYSGKSFRKVVWKTNQQIWAQLHEEAWRTFGGCPQYVVLDNLKEGVLRPHLYAPELNPVYSALLAHYGVVADPCRVGDPNRKGTVERAIQHTQTTALKGRTFESLDAQNTWLAQWEERWAALRIHGRTKRQVLELFREEQPQLRPLPPTGFPLFTQVVRTVDDAGLVQVEGAYYAALPAAPHSLVTVRLYGHEIEIRDATGGVLRRHEKAPRKGQFVLADTDRLFNPSRDTARVLAKVEQIGPRTAALARELFARLGRPGQRAIYGVANLTRTYTCAEIESVCARLLDASCVSYAALKRALQRQVEVRHAPPADLTQAGAAIRALREYQSFWDAHTHTHSQENTDDHVCH